MISQDLITWAENCYFAIASAFSAIVSPIVNNNSLSDIRKIPENNRRENVKVCEVPYGGQFCKNVGKLVGKTLKSP